MSKISRRNFIKGAGVAALAVAAAGMLAGCGSSAPEMVGSMWAIIIRTSLAMLSLFRMLTSMQRLFLS